MLSGNGRNSKVGKSILNWMKYRNPTLISKPNEKFGFGRLQAKDNFRKRLNDLSLAEEMDKDVIKVLSFEKLSGNSDEDGAHPHKLWNIRAFSPLPEIAGIPPAKVNSDFPAWKNSRGEILTQLFSSEDKKNLAEEVGKLKPSGETVISIHFNGRNILPRFRIIKSCGFLVLDRKALKSLILNYRELFDSGFESGNVIIEWGPFRAE
jgi:hypothetical protein